MVKNLLTNHKIEKQRKILKSTIRSSPGKQIWTRMLRSKISVFALCIICIIVLLSIFANFIVDESLVTMQNVTIRNQPPSSEHWFGTDIYGRDIFARVLYGSRISLIIGVVTVIISTVIGSMLGSIAAYFGGLLNDIIMRFADMLMAIPEQLLAMIIVAAMGATASSLILALSIAVIPHRIRLIHSTVLSIIGTEYVEAARACGMSDLRIIMTEILPNTLGPTIVVSTQGLASIILTASSLSYLGVGIQPPTPEWGAIISEAREYMRTAPYMVIIPGVVMVITALSFNLMGDGLRDAMDPRLKD